MIGVFSFNYGEIPKKVIPQAINNIPIRILIFYIGALIVIMSIYPWNAINPLESPFVQVFVAIGIVAAAGIVNFVVLTSAASACNSAVFSTSRMLYSLARDKNAPTPFAKLTSHKVPSNALFFSTIVILIAVVLKYRTTRPNLARLSIFRMPFYPISNYLILLFLAFVLVVLAEDTRVALFVTPVWFILLIAIYKMRPAKAKRKIAH